MLLHVYCLFIQQVCQSGVISPPTLSNLRAAVSTVVTLTVDAQKVWCGWCASLVRFRNCSVKADPKQVINATMLQLSAPQANRVRLVRCESDL